MTTLRLLLLQRAARLQERPALSAPEWGTLDWRQLRNKVEGVAFGLAAEGPPGPRHAATGTAWDWIAELAVVCCGGCWVEGAEPLDKALLGGVAFQAEAGRQAYHDLGEAIRPETLCLPGITHDAWLRRLRRLNGRLGWDHETVLELPAGAPGTLGGRGALWSALYAGAHAKFGTGRFDPGPFLGLWSE